MLAPSIHSQLLYAFPTLYRERSTIYLSSQGPFPTHDRRRVLEPHCQIRGETHKVAGAPTSSASQMIRLPISDQLWDTAGQERFRSVRDNAAA